MSRAVDDELWQELKRRFRAWTGMKLYDSVQVTALDRLRQLSTRAGFLDPAAYLEAVDGSAERRQPLLDQIGMGTTWFLRDRSGIDALVRALSRTLGKAETPWIWSAGCASGEEPYTLAMAFDAAGLSARVLATDLNGDLLAKARAGRYPRQAIAGIPVRWQTDYFEPAGRRHVRVTDKIRRRVEFRLHNFLTDRIPPPGWARFDAVVCRNVLIYFEHAEAAQAIERLGGACRADGYFLLGAVERPFLWMGDPQEVTPATELVRIQRRPLTAPADPRAARDARRGVVVPGKTRPPVLVSTGAAHDRTPTVQEALVAAEEVALSAPRVDDALARIGEVIALAPLSASAHLARGLTLWRAERLGEAADAFRMARCIDGTSWMAPYQLGRCLEELGEPRDACEAYLHALSVIEEGGRSGMARADERVEAMAQTAAEKCRAFIRWCRGLYDDG